MSATVRPFASIALVLATRDGARATLEALWSEPPGVPVELLVHATGPARDVVLREHPRRARLVGADDRPVGAALLELLLAGRSRVGLVLAEGARPAPGWARELTAVALGLAPGLERAPGLAVPRLVAPALAGPQAFTHGPGDAWPPTRRALRAIADRARFDERRVETLAHALPSAACVAFPRAALERLGWADPRRPTLGGAVADLFRRARAAGFPVRLARRALVALEAPVPPSPAERAPAGTVTSTTRLALELEPDDPAAPALARAALALVARGAPLLTFSRRPWGGGRPSPAPHVVAAGLATAARASDLLLLRASVADVDAPARRLLLPDEAEAAGDDVAPLRLAGDPDAWADQLLVLA